LGEFYEVDRNVGPATEKWLGTPEGVVVEEQEGILL